MCGYPLPLQNQRHIHTAIYQGGFLNITTKDESLPCVGISLTFIIGIIALCKETKILTATEFFWHHFHHQDCASALYLDDRTDDVLVVCGWRHGQSLTGADDHVQGDHIDDGNRLIMWKVILSSFDRSSTQLDLKLAYSWLILQNQRLKLCPPDMSWVWQPR